MRPLRNPAVQSHSVSAVPPLPDDSRSTDGLAWWQMPLDQLQHELSATPTGLTQSEVRARLKRYGPNQFRDQAERSLAGEFLRRFRNPLILILLAASAVSAFTGDMSSFLIIILMVLISVLLDFFQEH